MMFKKLILLLFILISLNTFYQPVQVNIYRYKHTIVRQMNADEDNLTKELIDKNKKIIFGEYISLLYQIMYIDKNVAINNTS